MGMERGHSRTRKLATGRSQLSGQTLCIPPVWRGTDFAPNPESGFWPAKLINSTSLAFVNGFTASGWYFKKLADYICKS
jgi:hypothetical protein